MLKQVGTNALWYSVPILPSFPPIACTSYCTSTSTKCFPIKSSHPTTRLAPETCCAARRRVRYDEKGEDEGVENEYNKEIGMLELYTQSARGEALLVHAMVDEDEVEVLIFKGFSSCLSYGTVPDPSRSVLPARAVIKSIDRIKGPFDPSKIEYLQKSITWEAFETNHLTLS